MAAAALSGCTQDGGVTVVTTPAEQRSAADSTAAPATQAPTRNAEDYVMTARNYEIDYHGEFYLTGEDYHQNSGSVARLPQLTLDSSDANSANSEINEHYTPIFDNYTSGSYVSGRTDYVCALNGSVLSLAIETRSVDTPNSSFSVYNFDVDTGSLLSNDEVAAATGVSVSDVQSAVAADINARFDTQKETLGNGNYLSQLETARERSLDSENLSDIDCFFDSEGRLNVTYRYYWIAGAENYGALLVTGYSFNG